MNKKLTLILLALPLLVITSFTSIKNETSTPELKWYSWNEGYAKAVKEGKIVLVDAYTDWCGWCKKMDRDTYTNADVIRKLNEHFVPIKFNPEIKDVVYMIGDSSYSPAELYHMLSNGQSTGYPTTYFIYTKKMSLFLEPGYKDAATFNTILDAAIAQNKN